MEIEYYVLVDEGVLNKDFHNYKKKAWAVKKFKAAMKEKEKHERIEFVERQYNEEDGMVVTDKILEAYYNVSYFA